MSVMTLETAAACLEHYIECNVPVYLWGPPGIGKSDVVKQVASKMNYSLIDIRLSLRDPVDLRGLPITDPKTGMTAWLPPSELPNEKRDGEKGILFLDEANTAPKSMEAPAMGLVLDRKLGDYKLPLGWVPIAAGNRLIDKAAANRVGTAMKNRFAHLEVGPDVEAWRKWAVGSNLHPLIRAFIQFRPELLHKMPQGEENAFPTPRAWEKVAKVVDAPKAVRQHLIAGLVGDGPAAEVEGFIRIWTTVPSLEEIKRNPSTAKVPGYDNPSACFAVAAAISAMATRENIAAIYTYAKRMPKEFEIMFMVDAVRREPALQKTKAYVEFFTNNSEVVI